MLIYSASGRILYNTRSGVRSARDRRDVTGEDLVSARSVTMIVRRETWTARSGFGKERYVLDARVVLLRTTSRMQSGNEKMTAIC